MRKASSSSLQIPNHPKKEVLLTKYTFRLTRVAGPVRRDWAEAFEVPRWII